jgi:TonB family protein
MTVQLPMAVRGGVFFRFYRMFFLSIALHILILCFILLIPAFPTPKWTFGPVYSVQLVDRAPSLSQEGVINSFTGRLSGSQRAIRAISLRSKADYRQTIPIRRIETPKLSQDIERALSAIRKESLQSVRENNPSPASLAARAPAGVNNDSNQKRYMQIYYSQIWSRIKGRWTLPPGVILSENLESVVDVRIKRNGAVTNIKFEKRSGNKYFDDSVLRAIGKAAPMPPLPDVIGDNDLDIGIRFHASDLP